MPFLNDYADRLVFLLSAAIIFIPLERVFPRVRQTTWRRARLGGDLLYMILGMIPFMLLSLAFIFVMVSLFAGFIPEAARAFVRSHPIWVQALGLMIAGDFYYYWTHRLFHAVPALWSFHAIHHSIEDMDWIAAHRTHPVDIAITNSGALIIALLFDASPAAVIIFSTQFAWHSLLKHSNVKISWGPLRWVYLTPTFHHWHHANAVHAHDRNFAGQLPIWDLLFGTAIMKETQGPEKYGVDDPVPTGFLASLAYPFRPRKTQTGTNAQRADK